MEEYNNYIDKDYRLTIPISLLRIYHDKVDEYLKVIIEKDNKVDYFYLRIPLKSPSRKQTQVRRKIPERIIKNLNCKKDDKITIKEIKLLKIKRAETPFKDKYFDLLYLFQNNNIMCDLFFKNNEEWCRLWSSSKCGGITKEIEIKRFIPINKETGEFFGLMQAESRKYGDKFDFTNIFLSEHKNFINGAEIIGIAKSMWKVGFIYNPHISQEKIEKWKANFLSELDLKFGYKAISQTVTTIAYSVYIDSKILNHIMNLTLKEIRIQVTTEFKNNKNSYFMDFIKGFIIKDVLGDGTAIHTISHNSLQIFISEQDSISQRDISAMLKECGIKSRIYKNHIYLSSDIFHCKWYFANDVFKGYLENRRRIVSHFVSHPYIKNFYKRFKDIEVIDENKFAGENYLSKNTARAFLRRNVKKEFLIKQKNKKGKIISFLLTEKGKSFLKLIESAIIEENNLYQPLILPIGESDRTGFEIPDNFNVSTTSGKNLYAAPASSASPL